MERGPTDDELVALCARMAVAYAADHEGEEVWKVTPAMAREAAQSLGTTDGQPPLEHTTATTTTH